MLHRADYSQPLCTAVQVALVSVYAQMGISPDAVVGHSSGEIAAAFACGGISLQDAITTAYYRGLVSENVARSGAMAVVGLSKVAVSRFLTTDTVTVACENSGSNTTISGAVDEVERVLASIRKHDSEILTRRLPVGVAYHSHHMHTAAKEYLELMASSMSQSSTSSALSAPMFSTAINIRIDSSTPLTPSYWCTNLTSPVSFHSAIKTVVDQLKESIFLEIGPHSTLASPIKQICEEMKSPCTHIPTLLKGITATSTFLSAVGRLYQYDMLIKDAQIAKMATVLTDLPSYPWENVPFGTESRVLNQCRTAYQDRHPLLGQRVAECTTLEPSWRSVLTLEDQPWIRDHRVGPDVVFPLAGYVALATEACRQITSNDGHDGYALRHLVAHTAMVVKGPVVELMTTLRRARLSDARVTDWWHFNVSTYSGTTWTEHCHGEVKPVPENDTQGQNPTLLKQIMPASKWYSHMEHVGLSFGPDFQRLSDITYSTLEPIASGTIQTNGIEYMAPGVHPCIIDQALQLIFVAQSYGLTRPQHLRMPTLVEEMYVATTFKSLKATAWISELDNHNVVECREGDHLKLRVHNVHLTTVGRHEAFSSEIEHAAASLHWYPDVDFMSNEELFGAPRTATDEDLLLEELTILCVIATQETLQNVARATATIETYCRWLGAQVSRIKSGDHTTLSCRASFLQLSATQRAHEIECRYERLMRSPSWKATAMCIKRAHDNAIGLCTGHIDFLDLVTQDGILADMYTAITFDCGNYVAALSHKQPTLRILEVGAGTGGATHLVLRSLSAGSPADTTLYGSYTFTDVSTGFFTQAKEKFKDWPDLDYRTLDISKDPSVQGYEPESFDLIIAANVLHATPRLSTTLENLKTLLGPGGRLVFSELDTTSRFPGYIFGWFSGWWLGMEDGRKDEPFISTERWRMELSNVGFEFERSEVDRQSHQLTTQIVARKQPLRLNRGLLDFSVVVLCDEACIGVPPILIERLQADGYQVCTAKLGDDLSGLKHIISTLDVETPVFGNLTPQRLAKLQSTLKSADEVESFLWMMNVAHENCKNPIIATSLGAMHTVRLELGIPMTVLEINNEEPSCIDLTLSVWNRVVTPEVTGRKQQPDRDYLVDRGAIKIGRYRPFSLTLERERKRSLLAKRPEVITLKVGQPRLIDTVRWAEEGDDIVVLKHDEVEIDNRAVGVNFRVC